MVSMAHVVNLFSAGPMASEQRIHGQHLQVPSHLDARGAGGP